ncbi:MAG: nuclear transport factor 2 family protein [Congregibacter sp.]|nr:nuclear transport factor 2 family protein [Congregibacter sp.]MDP5071845.1 nuclear transport factor 2 family protein [Congregibacter sp.]
MKVQKLSVTRKPATLHASLALGLLCTLLTGAQSVHAQTDEQAVLNAVTALFDAMRARDADALQSAFLPEGRLGTQGTQAWIASVASSNRYLDEVTFDETVLIDTNVAMAWTPYNLFIDGDFHHCGIDVFTFRKVATQWKILQLDDTRRTEGCDPARRGN